MASCRTVRLPGNAESPTAIKHGVKGALIAQTYDEPATDPWMARPKDVTGTGVVHCGPWVRGPYESIQVNVDHRGCNIVGDAANEPSIAIDPTDPRRIVIGWRQFDTIESDFRQAGWAYSHDAGHTWAFPGVLQPGVFGSDPVLDADGDGNLYYYTLTRLGGGDFFKSTDGGVSWIETASDFGGDKPWMATDRTKGIGRGNIYFNAGSSEFYRSTDGGACFDPFYIPTPSFPTMSVGPDGTLYTAGLGRLFTKSINAQDPDQVPVFDPPLLLDLGGDIQVAWPPNPGGLLGQIWVATDHSDGPTRGNVYFLGSVDQSIEDQLDVSFARSTDGGVTWSEKVRVNDDPEGNGAWQWFGMMSVAPNGRIDAVWNDTRNYLDAPHDSLCELYYSYSTDAGVTWSENIPVSPVFDSRIGWPHAQWKLGDYYHMLSDNLGVNVAYAATFNGEQDIYFLRIGPWDCNSNEIPDEDDIACGGGNTCGGIPGSYDCNENGVPDECEYRGDFDGDGVTTLRDLAAFQRCFTGALGATGGLPASALAQDPCCRLFDLDVDDNIDLADLMIFQRSFNGP
ncbi:MAG: sialidase family protein [Phycisphaerae bacterium]